jgi:surfactin synthase thioesterase subunit
VCTGARDAAAVLGAHDGPGVLTSASASAAARPVCLLLFPGTGRLRRSEVRDLGCAFPGFGRAVEGWLGRFERAGLPVGSVEGTVDGTGGAPGAALLFAVQAGFAGLWEEAGIRPSALVGDGIGGLVAAVVGGLVTPADAVHLIVRGADGARLPGTPPAVAVHLTSAVPAAGEPQLWTREAAGEARLARTLDAVRRDLGPAVVLEPGPGGPPADVAVLATFARLWTHGHDIRWDALGQPVLRRRVALPAYPYGRESRWRGRAEPGPVRPVAATAAALVASAPDRVADPAIAVDALGTAGAGPTVVTLNYAGGSSRAFRPLRRFLPPDCLLALTDLPGHGRRIGRPCLRDADVAVSELAAAVRALPAGRLVLVGYSLGGVLAYELAARLAEVGTPPDGLVVCGTRAPHTGVGHPPVAHLPAGEPFLRAAFERGLAAREMVEIPELAEAFGAPLHADLAMVESFRHRPRAPLPVPVCVIGFRSDWLVPEPSLRAWDTVCRDPPLHVRLDGGHLAIHDREAEFAAAVGAAVERVLAIPARHAPLYGTTTGSGPSPTVEERRFGRGRDTPQPGGGGR